MKRWVAFSAIALLSAGTLAPFSFSQTASPKLSVHWEELTAADFREGIRRSQGTCLLPFGILEKHGPHLPLEELDSCRVRGIRREGRSL